MGQRQQTSVRISTRALECLSAVANDRDVSREQAVRELLREHVAAQAAASEERRLTHISTALRFPPPVPGRRRPDGRVRLAVRLDPDLADRAASMSLRLPGQAARRGFRDYGARPLTDAVVTAIARVKPFVDHGLEGLPPLLTHREAVGLWRLTIAATLTRAEQRVLFGSQGDPTADVLREEDVAWHDPWRFGVALHLARQLLTGPDAEANLRMLWDQTKEFESLRSDLELSDDLDHRYLEGMSWPANDLQGRGGAAVWRAQRKLAVERIAYWLSSGSGPIPVEPPGWTLVVPAGWRGYRFGYRDLPPLRQSELDHGRVLRVDAGSRSVLWPYDAAGAPIRGVDAVIAGAGDIPPAELVELILLTAEDTETYPRVPAIVACELGFISPTDRDRLVADAARHNESEIAGVLRRARRLGREAQDALRAKADDPQRFAALARRWHLRCHLTQPTWTWPVESISDALASGASPAQLRWLASATRRIRGYQLERDMERAWSQAFWLGRTVVDDGV